MTGALLVGMLLGCDDEASGHRPDGDLVSDADVDDEHSFDADEDWSVPDGDAPVDGSPDADVDVDVDVDVDLDVPPVEGLAFNEAIFATTHNSYSGSERGSILEQLDRGVRSIELDVQDNDFQTFGFRVGHDGPGDEVWRAGGNPEGDGLREWLSLIAAWSSEHRHHGPITLTLDLKDDLTDNRSFVEGNLAHLNAMVLDVFGDTLVAAADLSEGGWPGIEELRGRVLLVLSGHLGSRLAYRRDQGSSPAVAIDAAGRVVEVHDDGHGALWYWTGQLEGDRVSWRRHGRYDTGQEPAIALEEGGLLVEVHEDPDAGDDQLWYRVGELGDDLEIRWYHDGGLPFPGADEGVDPSLTFLARGELREVHVSARTGDHWSWNGSWNPTTERVDWWRGADGGQTEDPLYPRDVASAGGATVSVSTGADGPYGADTLLYSVGAGRRQRISYRQLAFVELQRGDGAPLSSDGLLFLSADGRDGAARSWAEDSRRAGLCVRLWQVNDPSQLTDPPVTYPATDTPFAAWYLEHCRAVGCVE